MKKLLKKVCFVFLLTTFSSAYAGGCFDKVSGVDDCRVKAEQGDADAQFNLGVRYDTGEGVLQDHQQAVKWYRKAAEQGDALAQYNLGTKYDAGQGVLQDYKQAAEWWSKAAEQGHAKAQNNLGRMYENGKVPPPEYLGFTYGEEQDPVKAHMYYNIAAANGHSKAAGSRNRMEKRMSASQLAEAQKLAREWMRKH